MKGSHTCWDRWIRITGRMYDNKADDLWKKLNHESELMALAMWHVLNSFGLLSAAAERMVDNDRS